MIIFRTLHNTTNSNNQNNNDHNSKANQCNYNESAADTSDPDKKNKTK